MHCRGAGGYGFTLALESGIMLPELCEREGRKEEMLMSRRATILITVLLTAFCGTSLCSGEQGAAATRQSEADEYTRYELLAPDSASFRISYEVSAATPGATVFFNPIRKGSLPSDEAVYDAMTGEPLRFEVVSGAEVAKPARQPP